MPRSDDSSPRYRRRKEKHKSRDRSPSSSRDHRDSKIRDKHRRKDSRSKRRSISPEHKRPYDRSPASYHSTSTHRSKRQSPSRNRPRTDHKKSRHRRDRSTSSNSSSSSKTSVSTLRSKSQSRKPSSSPEQKLVDPAITKDINLESSTNEEKRRQLIDEIDADSFVPRTFSSSNKKLSDKVIIDLQKETISVAKVENTKEDNDQFIHPNFLGNQDERTEKWIRKLFVYRQKYFDD